MTDLLLLLGIALAGPLLGLGAVWADGPPTARHVLTATVLGGGAVAELGALIMLLWGEHGGFGVGATFGWMAMYGAVDGLVVGLVFVAIRALLKRRAAHGTA
jgi:hypothetical protein